MGIGRLYFAAVGDAEVFDEGTHLVEDLQVYNLRISQSEAEFARAELEVTNPKVGLLLDTQKQRLFISCEETPGGPIRLLFSGRITGLPLDLDAEIVTLEYIAQPEGWQDTQETFIDSLKVQPYYNELFIPLEDRNNPEHVLAARSSLLHWNRSTGALTLSDILQGTDTVDVGGEFYFDSLSTSIGDPPLRSVDLNIEVQWEQLGVGVADVGEAIRLQFNNTTGPQHQLNSLTPDSFMEGWDGVQIPKGYELLDKRIYHVANGMGLAAAHLQSSQATVDGTVYRNAKGFDPGGNRTCRVPRVWFKGKLTLLGTYRQKRTERFQVLLESQTQSYSLAGELSETVFLRIEDPVSAANGAVLDPSEESFFINMGSGAFTSHGEDALQHGVLRARARLAKAMRAVESSFETLLTPDLLDISCDTSVHLVDDRIPGGELLGKVLGYVIEVDGASGKQNVTVSLGSAVGLGFDSVGPVGNTVLEDVEYDTLNDPSTMTSALYYGDPSNDVSAPIDVAEMESDPFYLISLVTVQNPGQSQNNGFAASSTPDVYLEANKTRVVVDLVSLNPEPVLEAAIEALFQPITWPKQIDLGTTIYNLATEAGEDLLTEAGDEIVV